MLLRAGCRIFEIYHVLDHFQCDPLVSSTKTMLELCFVELIKYLKSPAAREILILMRDAIVMIMMIRSQNCSNASDCVNRVFTYLQSTAAFLVNHVRYR